jgi:hypothetical protein
MTLASLFYINFNKESYVHCFVVEASNFNFFFEKKHRMHMDLCESSGNKHGFFSPMLGATWAM